MLFKSRSRSEVITLMRRIYDSVDLRNNLNCRRIESGVWYESRARLSEESLTTFRPDPPIYLVPRSADWGRWLNDAIDAETITLDLRSIIRSCRKAVQSPDEFGAIILPNLWIPPENHPHLELVEATREILTRLKAGHLSLKDITWRQLEEIVAELLQGRGMEVTLTPAGSDGGRDVIARGELIPGEPVVLAVEVKHRDIVSLDEVRSRLYANKEFPALLFATSGRFSAGVVREKKKPENFLRMFLKDGVALRQWIDNYGSA
jgi:predicted Mrr-cat superfamily restriction endonuclease